MALKHQLGENLREIRKRKGLTQSALASQIFVTTQAISKWERGESEPGVEHIQKLCRMLNITADALLGIHPIAKPALLAVDGGGTKTEFVLISPDGELRKRLLLPGANPNSSSFEHSFQVLCSGIDQMLHTDYQIIGIYIGCAGMGSGDHGAVMSKRLSKEYSGITIRCDSDICNILACAKDPDNAIAVISGTGSVVYGTMNGRLIRAGGGGWQLDSLGSGYELGRAALSAALADADGTGPATVLRKEVEEKLGDRVWNRISQIYQYHPAQIADFASIVINAWQAGDEVATEIIECNVKRLAELVQLVATKSAEAKEVIFGGSLLTGCEPFRNLLVGMLPNRLHCNTIDYPPVWGACLQCAKLCGIAAPDAVRFMDGYKTEVL